jgi:hypothetical protein
VTEETDIAELRKALDDSLMAIEKYDDRISTGSVVGEHLSSPHNNWENASSLLSRCETVTSAYAGEQKPLLRVIHHFACTGGTLISKCLAGMPGAFLLSEVHPRSQLTKYKSVFAPSDISLLSRSARIPRIDELCDEIFLASIESAYRHVQTIGGTLVLRDHTHSDFCTGDSPVLNSSIDATLKKRFEIRSLVTTRHPLDSYLSLQKNNWLHFSPASLDEYAKRYLAFLSPFADTQIIKYEDFCLSPQSILESICSTFEMSYDDQFEQYFDIFDISGDSGRTGIATIKLRKRQEISEHVKEQAEQSEAYRQLCSRLIYDWK